MTSFLKSARVYVRQELMALQLYNSAVRSSQLSNFMQNLICDQALSSFSESLLLVSLF